MTGVQVAALVVLVIGLVLDVRSTSIAYRLGLKEKVFVFRTKTGRPNVPLVVGFAIATVVLYLLLTTVTEQSYVWIIGVGLGVWRAFIGIRNFQIITDYLR